MKIGIVITCKNLWEYTSVALASIFTTHPYHIVVVDDGSTDYTKTGLKEFQAVEPRLSVITNPTADSLSAKWNMGIALAFEQMCEAVLVCNNDIILNPVTIDALVARLGKGDVGMVTAHNLRGELARPEDILAFPVTYESTEAPHPDFSCFLISKKTYEEVGPFDENFSPCYFEDGDYHLRMGKLHIKAITITGAPYYHYGSKTQNSVYGGLCSPARFEQLREYLRAKHGAVPGEPLYDEICQGSI